MEIIVQGKGVEYFAPNEVVLNINFNTKGLTYEEVLSEGTRNVQHFVNELLLKNGFQKEDMKTRNFVIREETKYNNITRNYDHDGYSFNQMAVLRFDYDKELMAKMMVAISRLENAPMCQVKFEVKDEKECNSAVGICNSSESGYMIGVTKDECYDIGTWIDATPVYGGLEMIDMYWKIIRINGDNSIRMIYSNSAGVGLSKYHEFDNQSEYVGYMYEIGKQHGYKDDSAIKLYVDNWYKTTSLIGTDSKYVADTIFCNDRDASLSKSNFSTLTNWNSTGVNYYYRGISKFYGDSLEHFNGDLKPNFLCLNDDDRFTVSNIKGKGNGALTYPVGLITADEAYFYPSGGYMFVYTMTPTEFINESGIVALGPTGALNYEVSYTGAVRPVISLSSKVKLTGDGSPDAPYVIDPESCS